MLCRTCEIENSWFYHEKYMAILEICSILEMKWQKHETSKTGLNLELLCFANRVSRTCVLCRYQMSDLRLCHINFYALLNNSFHYLTKTPILTKILGVEKSTLKFDSKIDLEKTKRQTLLNSLLLPCWHFLKEKTLINFTRIQTTVPILFIQREIVTNLVLSIKGMSMSLLKNFNHQIRNESKSIYISLHL